MSKFGSNLEIPDIHEDQKIKDWCQQFQGLCVNEGDVYPDLFHDPSHISLGGAFIVNVAGKRLFIKEEDYGWEPYDYDRDGNEEVYGFNSLVATIVDLDRGEYIAKDYDMEPAEDDRFQGFATAIGELIAHGVAYPEGDWDFVLSEMRDMGIFDD